MKVQAFLAVLVFGIGQIGFAQTETLESFESRKVRSREAWGARPAKLDMTRELDKRVIAIHHTAGSAVSSDATVRNVQDGHFARKFSDIGYHYLVGVDGKIYKGRSLEFQGAHVLGHNNHSIGLNFIGCFDSNECHPPQYPAVASVTEAMIQSMGELLGVLSAHFGIIINSTSVKGHREFRGAKTACPGDRILARMSDIRNIARAKAGQGNKDEL